MLWLYIKCKWIHLKYFISASYVYLVAYTIVVAVNVSCAFCIEVCHSMTIAQSAAWRTGTCTITWNAAPEMVLAPQVIDYQHTNKSHRWLPGQHGLSRQRRTKTFLDYGRLVPNHWSWKLTIEILVYKLLNCVVWVFVVEGRNVLGMSCPG